MNPGGRVGYNRRSNFYTEMYRQKIFWNTRKAGTCVKVSNYDSPQKCVQHGTNILKQQKGLDISH